MNLILHYWYFAPSFYIALAAAYFAYRVLAGYVNTPEKAVKQAYEARAGYVLGRINKKNGVCECNSVGVRIGVLSPPCDYCKGLKAGAPKEVEVNPLEISLPLMWQTDNNLDYNKKGALRLSEIEQKQVSLEDIPNGASRWIFYSSDSGESFRLLHKVDYHINNDFISTSENNHYLFIEHVFPHSHFFHRVERNSNYKYRRLLIYRK